VYNFTIPLINLQYKRIFKVANVELEKISNWFDTREMDKNLDNYIDYIDEYNKSSDTICCHHCYKNNKVTSKYRHYWPISFPQHPRCYDFCQEVHTRD
jgi:hypothetical protein